MFSSFSSIIAVTATVCLSLLAVDPLIGNTFSTNHDVLSESIRSSLASMPRRRLQSTPLVPFTIGGTEYNDFYDTTSEHYGNCGSGPVDSKKFDSCSESCAVGWTAAGEWLLYDFDAPSAGEVDIVVALSSFGSNKIVSIDVDGTEIGKATAPGQGWATFKDRMVEKVSLTAGSHQLKILFISGNTNLCSITVDYVGPAPPAPAPTPAPPTANPTSRIKMYHEKGYFWQCDDICDDSDPSKDFDPEWCFQCDGTTCDNDEFVKLRKCDASQSQTENTKFELVLVGTSTDYAQIRAANSNLCLTTTNYQDKTNRLNTRMKTCDDSDSQIWWTGGYGSFTSNRRFEVHPKDDSSYCLTTQHHPKDGEDGRVERCAFARKDVSNWWIKYSP